MTVALGFTIAAAALVLRLRAITRLIARWRALGPGEWSETVRPARRAWPCWVMLIGIILAASSLSAQERRPLTSVKGVSSPVKVETKDLAGEWYIGDGVGYNVTLTLNENGTYTAVWNGCIGEYGSARGTWTHAADQVSLTPIEETGMMVDRFRGLTAVMFRTKLLLVSAADENRFLENGTSDSSCFHRPGDLPRWWEAWQSP